jgi:alpha-L-fucosidase 2
MNRHYYRTFVFCFLLSGYSYGQTADHALQLWYDHPASIWEEALPLGNGRTGAMVFGYVAKERIQLNDNTLWSGYPDPGNNPNAQKYLPLVRKAVAAGDYEMAARYWKKMQGPYSARYLHMANLMLDFKLPDTVVSDYKRTLDLNTATAAVTFRSRGVTFNREVFTSHPDKIMVMRLTAGKKKSISFTASLASKLKYSTRLSDQTLVLKAKAPMYAANREAEPLQLVYDDEAGEGMNVDVRIRIAHEGGTVQYTDSSISVINADAATLYLSEATSFNGFDKSPGLQGKDPAIESARLLDNSFGKPYAKLKGDHLKDYQPLFNRVKLVLGNTVQTSKLPTDDRMIRFNEGTQDHSLLTLYYQFGRYLLISSSRPGSPPASLQGLWNDHLQPPWGSNYTTNINTQMNYWPAESTNLSECHEPLLRFIHSLSINGAATAKINYGIQQGWCAHHNSDIWAKTSPPGGYEWDPRSQARWACWPMSGAWFSLHLWDHYLFTGDEQYLRKDAWPLMKGAAQFLLSWLVEGPDGYLVTNPSTSPENVFKVNGKEYQVSMATTMDMSITRELFKSCVQAATRLNTDDPFKKELTAALEKLYPYHVGQHGQLQEWFKDWDDPEDKHRHLSHLFGLHPGTQISPFSTPELASAAKQSLVHRGDVSTGWSMAWKINWWARLYDGNHALKILKDGLTYIGPKKGETTRGGTYPNMFDAHPPFQIDGNFGGTAGMTEMLMQSHLGELYLLPALPDEWKDGSIQGIKGRGGFEIALDWTGGKIKKALITSTLGGNCRIRSAVPLKVLEASSTPATGENPNPLLVTPKPVSFIDHSKNTKANPDAGKGYAIDFVTEKGKTYTLVPQ